MARAADGLAAGEVSGGERTENRSGFELRGAWGSSGLVQSPPPLQNGK